jgi:hypothetical protein
MKRCCLAALLALLASSARSDGIGGNGVGSDVFGGIGFSGQAAAPNPSVLLINTGSALLINTGSKFLIHN